jgi:hypothetical protein
MQTDHFVLDQRYLRFQPGITEIAPETVRQMKTGDEVWLNIAAIVISGTIFFFIGLSVQNPLQGFPGGAIYYIILLFSLYGLYRLLVFLLWKLRPSPAKRLNEDGLLVEGRLVRAWYEVKKESLSSLADRSFTRTLNANYTFRTPMGHELSGKQVAKETVYANSLNDKQFLLNAPLPPNGTPVYVLYADDNNYVML